METHEAERALKSTGGIYAVGALWGRKVHLEHLAKTDLTYPANLKAKESIDAHFWVKNKRHATFKTWAVKCAWPRLLNPFSYVGLSRRNALMESSAFDFTSCDMNKS